MIHPPRQRLSHYPSGENYRVTAGAVGSAMDLAEAVETLSTDGCLVGALLPGLSARGRRQVAYDIPLPNVMFCLHPDYAVRCLLRPLAVNRTAIRCDWLFGEETRQRGEPSTRIVMMSAPWYWRWRTEEA